MRGTIDCDSHVVATTEVGIASLVDDQQLVATFMLHLDVKERLRAECLDNPDLASDAGAIRSELEVFWTNTDTKGRAVDRRGSGRHLGA